MIVNGADVSRDVEAILPDLSSAVTVQHFPFVLRQCFLSSYYYYLILLVSITPPVAFNSARCGLAQVASQLYVAGFAVACLFKYQTVACAIFLLARRNFC